MNEKQTKYSCAGIGGYFSTNSAKHLLKRC